MKNANSFLELVGNTPLIKLQAVSAETGCDIYGKAEFMNPGGSVKDRAAKAIIEAAEASGALKKGGTIVEGTAGNTGISLTLAANARGYRSIIVMPETQSQEKKDALRLYGADLRLVPAAPYKDPNNYVRYSERLAAELSQTTEAGLSGQISSIIPSTDTAITPLLDQKYGRRLTARLTALSVLSVLAARLREPGYI